MYQPLPRYAQEKEEVEGGRLGQHLMVLCGSMDGHWLFQDSNGTKQGDAGYIKIRKHMETLTEFVEMS